MFKITNLKLYRKFVILAVLIGCLSFISSINRSHAQPCCSELHCEENYNSCVAFCNYAWQFNPTKRALCIGFCEDDYWACQAQWCDNGC